MFMNISVSQKRHQNMSRRTWNYVKHVFDLNPFHKNSICSSCIIIHILLKYLMYSVSVVWKVVNKVSLFRHSFAARLMLGRCSALWSVRYHTQDVWRKSPSISACVCWHQQLQPITELPLPEPGHNPARKDNSLSAFARFSLNLQSEN